MSGPTKSAALLPLVTQLRACPSIANGLSQKRLCETWGCFTQIALEHGEPVTPAILAGLILHDPDTFAPLLNEAERSQLEALAKAALGRYLEQINPPNKLGKTIAASLKEPT